MYWNADDTSTQRNTLEGQGGWSDMIQNAVGKWAGSAIDYRYNQQYQLQKMAMQQNAPNGVPYYEGQPGVPAVSASASGTIPMSWLLIGGVLLFAMSGD
jgi:hypothetical protein